MHYTYILRSHRQPGAVYIGYTKELKSRLSEHNNEKSKSYSSRFSPWEIESYFAFNKGEEANRFETYLKSNSGKAFMRRRLISTQFRVALAKFNNGRGDKVSVTK